MRNEVAKDFLTALWGRDDININETIALEMAIKALEQKETVGWISVSKANPKKNGRYFVTTDGNYVAIKSFAKNLREIDKYDFDKAEPGWYDYDSDFGYYKYHKVIAWMELPEPYKGAENEC